MGQNTACIVLRIVLVHLVCNKKKKKKKEKSPYAENIKSAGIKRDRDFFFLFLLAYAYNTSDILSPKTIFLRKSTVLKEKSCMPVFVSSRNFGTYTKRRGISRNSTRNAKAAAACPTGRLTNPFRFRELSARQSETK